MPIREASAFFARRALAAVISLIVVSLLVFAFLYAAPGSPAEAIIGPLGSTPAVLKAVAHQYGLDRPVTTQYFQFIGHAARLDFGHSFFTGQSVMQGIIQRLAVTIPLGLGGFLFAMVFGIATDTKFSSRTTYLLIPLPQDLLAATRSIRHLGVM